LAPELWQAAAIEAERRGLTRDQLSRFSPTYAPSA
jgi:hypothetical protein